MSHEVMNIHFITGTCQTVEVVWSPPHRTLDTSQVSSLPNVGLANEVGEQKLKSSLKNKMKPTNPNADTYVEEQKQ